MVGLLYLKLGYLDPFHGPLLMDSLSLTLDGIVLGACMSCYLHWHLQSSGAVVHPFALAYLLIQMKQMFQSYQ